MTHFELSNAFPIQARLSYRKSLLRHTGVGRYPGGAGMVLLFQNPWIPANSMPE